MDDVLVPSTRAPTPRPSPAEIAAEQLKHHLITSYQVVAEVRTNGTARVTVNRRLDVWVYHDVYRWDSGQADPRGRIRYVAMPIDQPAAAADLIARRYHALRLADRYPAPPQGAGQ